MTAISEDKEGPDHSGPIFSAWNFGKISSNNFSLLLETRCYNSGVDERTRESKVLIPTLRLQLEVVGYAEAY